MPQGPRDRRIAPHVQAAMTVIQPMARGLSPARVPPAAHLQVAVERSRQPPPPSAPAKAGLVPAPRVQGPTAQTKMPPGPPRAGSSGVVQRASTVRLTGEYERVGNKLMKYSLDFYNEWEAKLLEGQALGRPAPKIGVHAGGSSGGDNSSAPVRIEKARTALNGWYASLKQSQTDRGLDKVESADEDEFTGSSSSRSYRRVDVDREARKKEKKRARQLEYQETEKTSTYVPPWHGGPSPWHK